MRDPHTAPPFPRSHETRCPLAAHTIAVNKYTYSALAAVRTSTPPSYATLLGRTAANKSKSMDGIPTRGACSGLRTAIETRASARTPHPARLQRCFSNNFQKKLRNDQAAKKIGKSKIPPRRLPINHCTYVTEFNLRHLHHPFAEIHCRLGRARS